MSWSFKILTLYLGFVALIVTLVVTCFQHPTDLEFKDYYARELKFQDQLNAQSNADALKESIDCSVKNGAVVLSFPTALMPGDLKGNVLFMRPSDSSQDKLVQIAPNAEGKQVITDLTKGVYKVRIEASSNGVNYLKQAVITIR